MGIMDEILTRVEPLDIAGEYLNFKRAGKNYVGLCPFHAEKTPSFSFDPERGLFYCFGCGKSGNILQFVAEMEGITTYDALKKLAEKANIPLRDKRGTRKYERIYNAVKFAKDFYHQSLLGRGGEEARNYLRDRNISISTIRAFEIGFAPAGGKALLHEGRKRGIDPSSLFDAGLLGAREGGEVRDFFRDRIIFPIYNAGGSPCGFGARTISNEEPKYINSPETPIFHKSKIMYGFNFTKTEIKKSGYGILVEGYIDLIKVYQAGIHQVVAPLGTSLTEEHIKLLRRYANRVFIVFDPDEAGKRAMQRSLPVLLKWAIDTRIVQLPEGQDPDAYITEKGKEAFSELIEKSEDFIDVLKGNINSNEPFKVKEKLDELLTLISVIDDATLRESCLNKVSNIFSIHRETLSSKVANLKNHSKKKGFESNPAPGGVSSDLRLVVHLLLSKEPFEQLLNSFEPNDFQDPLVRKIINLVKNEKSLNEILEEIDEQEKDTFVSAYIKAQSQPFGKGEDAFRKLMERTLRVRKQKLLSTLSRYEKEGNYKEAEKILMELNNLYNQGENYG